MQVIPLARNPREKTKTKKKEKKHVTVLQFVPNHRYAIHVWKIVPRNHAVVICSDIFSHVYPGSPKIVKFRWAKIYVNFWILVEKIT